MHSFCGSSRMALSFLERWVVRACGVHSQPVEAKTFYIFKWTDSCWFFLYIYIFVWSVFVFSGQTFDWWLWRAYFHLSHDCRGLQYWRHLHSGSLMSQLTRTVYVLSSCTFQPKLSWQQLGTHMSSETGIFQWEWCQSLLHEASDVHINHTALLQCLHCSATKKHQRNVSKLQILSLISTLKKGFYIIFTGSKT